MKRFASQYLYGFSGKVYKQSVVELDEVHRVISYYPLVEEIYSLYWLGGVIILSANPDYHYMQGTTFDQLISTLTEKTNNTLLPFYAYHLSGIELQEKKLLSSTRLTLL